VVDPNRITEVRRALGRQLAVYRQAVGLSQHQFAPLTHYDRSTVATVEVGRQNVPRTFWERAGAALGTGGSLTARYDEFMLLVREQRRESAIGRPVHPIEFGEQEVNPVPTRREVCGYLGAGLTAVGLDEFTTGRWAGLPRVVHALAVTQQAQVSDRIALEDLNTIIEHYKRTFRSTPPAELYNEILGVRALLGNADKVYRHATVCRGGHRQASSEYPTQGTFSISVADDPPYTATSLLLLGRYQEEWRVVSERLTAGSLRRLPSSIGCGGKDGKGRACCFTYGR
jgi:Helix-turn-helix domain